MTPDQEAAAALYNKSPDQHLVRAAEIAATSCHEAGVDTREIRIHTQLLWAIAKSIADDYQGDGK